MTDNSYDSLNNGFPWFEENNYTGWFIQFKAHLRRTDSLAPIMGARPTPPLDAAGFAIPQNQAMGRAMGTAQAAYDKADNIAFSDLMKACRRNPKTKILTETGDFEGAFALITRLKSRYNNIDEVKKASHLLKYHSLAQKEQESGADYVAREQQEFVALKAMGVDVDDALRLTKFIQDKTTNSQHQVLAQTIYSTPQITLSRATSLFEGYTPSSTTVEPSINAITKICSFCKNKGHTSGECRKRKASKDRDKDSNRGQRGNKDQGQSHQKPRFPCGICDSKNHSAFKCPMKKEVMQCVKKLKQQKGSNWGNDEEGGDEDKM